MNSKPVAEEVPTTTVALDSLLAIRSGTTDHHQEPRRTWAQPGGAYPELVVVVEGIHQLDYVVVVTFGQNVNLHHVLLQLLLAFGLDHLGRSQDAGLLVFGLEGKKERRRKRTLLKLSV